MDLLVAVLALVGGYLAGSIPLSAMVGQAAGITTARDGARGGGPGVLDVWRLAGPGWGLLAVTGDLAKGLLPVAIGVVTWSWWAGWAAGLGALLGEGWPLPGRLPGGRGVAVMAGGRRLAVMTGGRGVAAMAGARGVVVMAGALVALSPAAGLVALILALIAAGAARLASRAGLAVAVATWLAAYPLLFLLDQDDPARLAGIAVMYLVAVLRTTTISR